MRVLWICNIMLPMVAEHLKQEKNVKEGWITGLANQVLSHADSNGIELGVCFPAGKELTGWKGTVTGCVNGKKCSLRAYGFYENTVRPDLYDKNLETELSAVFEDFKPDVIHCFGTEYPHTLAAMRACPDKEKVLLGIQGICFALAEAYKADLPEKIYKRYLLRDFLKRDNIEDQQKKFYKRGQMEKEALQLAHHVTGRTAWDKEQVLSVNPQLQYHTMNETLRPVFYEGRWKKEACRPHSVFLSQGDYPIKGLHYVLQALPKILRKYPDAHVFVAGQSIIKYQTLKEKLKISSYGKYLLQIIKKEKLEDKVTFLGKLNADEMKLHYLASQVFLCPSVLENSPNSLGEAMLLGVPCVAARVGGIPSLFSEKEGILFEGGNTSALADAVIRMFDETGKIDAYTENAGKRALCNHDAENNYHILLQIYNKICADSKEDIPKEKSLCE